MKKTNWILILLSLLIWTGCVQKTNKKTVVFLLQLKQANDIDSVNLSGNDKPLHDEVTNMTLLVKDSLYTDTVTFVTGYSFTEVKFTINYTTGKPKEESRKIYFNKGDTTIFKEIID